MIKGVVLASLLFLTSCLSSELESVKFLEGTWKMEGKENYEMWRMTGESLEGQGYKMKDGEKKVSETLRISAEGDKITYYATVPNQNNGAAIAFTLNTAVEGKFSFENLGHDFPKKIQYEVKSADKLFVRVLGENDQGFSYNLIRQ